MNKIKYINGNKVLRRMNMLERVFYMVPGYKVSISARLEGDVDEERFRKSILKIQDIHPLLRSRVVFDDNGNAFFTTENVQPIDVSVVDMTTDEQWYELFVKNISVLYEPENKPMISFVLIKGSKYSDLLIMASHSITDGMAVVFILRDLLEAYAEPGAKVESLFPYEVMDFVPARVLHSFKNTIGGWYARMISRKWNKQPVFFNHEDYRAANKWFWKNNDYQAIFFELDKDDIKLLSQRCHNEQVSMGNAIATAFIASYQEINGQFHGSQKMVSIPFDLRRHSERNIGDIVSMCSGSIDISMRYDPHKSIWENARSFQEKVVNKTRKLNTGFMELLHYDPNLLDALSTFAMPAITDPEGLDTTPNLQKLIANKDNVAFKIFNKYKDKAPGTVSSNLGRLDIPQDYGNIHLNRVVLIPLLKSSSPLFQTISTIGNKLVFAMSFSTPNGITQASKMKEMTDIRSKALSLLGFRNKDSEERYVR